MVYDRGAVKKALAAPRRPRGALSPGPSWRLGESRLDEAAALMKQCLAGISSEDVDFRAAVNQQLYMVYRALAQSGIRESRSPQELTSCLGMSQTVSTLADEMETLFALAEAYECKGDYRDRRPHAAKRHRHLRPVRVPDFLRPRGRRERLLTGA